MRIKFVYNIGGLNYNITKLYGIIMLNYVCFNDQYELQEECLLYLLFNVMSYKVKMP